MTSLTRKSLVYRVGFAGISLVVASGLAACGSAKKHPAPSPSPTSSAPAPSPAAVPVSPLTGLPSNSHQTILAVKVPNTPEARPQAGLGHADMMVEELVEGGLTRFAAYFQSDLPGVVGPVRSGRDSDIGLAGPLNAVIVASGSEPGVAQNIRNHGIRYQEEGAGYTRDHSRVAPYNLFANLGFLGQKWGLSDPTAPLLPFAPPSTPPAPPSGAPATSVAVRFGAARTSTFAFQGGHYVMTNGYAPGDDLFQADTLVIIRVQELDAGYKDPAGNFVPEAQTSGSGPLTVIHGGTAINGTWAKANPGTPYQFQTAAGAPLSLPPGRVWIELAPSDASGGSVSFS